MTQQSILHLGLVANLEVIPINLGYISPISQKPRWTDFHQILHFHSSRSRGHNTISEYSTLTHDLDQYMTLTFNCGEVGSWPIHIQKLTFKGQSVQKIEKKQTDRRTDGRTDITDCFIMPVNMVSNETYRGLRMNGRTRLTTDGRWRHDVDDDDNDDGEQLTWRHHTRDQLKSSSSSSSTR